jgi:hypothetical protein
MSWDWKTLTSRGWNLHEPSSNLHERGLEKPHESAAEKLDEPGLEKPHEPAMENPDEPGLGEP